MTTATIGEDGIIFIGRSPIPWPFLRRSLHHEIKNPKVPRRTPPPLRSCQGLLLPPRGGRVSETYVGALPELVGLPHQPPVHSKRRPHIGLFVACAVAPVRIIGGATDVDIRAAGARHGTARRWFPRSAAGQRMWPVPLPAPFVGLLLLSFLVFLPLRDLRATATAVRSVRLRRPSPRGTRGHPHRMRWRSIPSGGPLHAAAHRSLIGGQPGGASPTAAFVVVLPLKVGTWSRLLCDEDFRLQLPGVEWTAGENTVPAELRSSSLHDGETRGKMGTLRGWGESCRRPALLYRQLRLSSSATVRDHEKSRHLPP